jgi:hypothetical protein
MKKGTRATFTLNLSRDAAQGLRISRCEYMRLFLNALGSLKLMGV